MCGICGKLIFKDSVPDPESIKAMCRTIVHRGPDDEGIYTDPHIGMGQRRLSIIDLAPGACPPISNEDRTVWLVFNGEIYNFQELRNQLQQRGHRFTTKSDTEVIIHLYEDEGVACLQKLRGMFAFALWDKRREILFCAGTEWGRNRSVISGPRNPLYLVQRSRPSPLIPMSAFLRITMPLTSI